MNILKSFILAALFCAALVIVSQPCNAQTSSTSGLAGNWQGTLTAAGTKVRMALNVKQESGGQFTATLDLPDNGAAGLPVKHVIYVDHILSFDVNVGAPSSYAGVVSRDATEVVGNLTQGPNIVPLNF